MPSDSFITFCQFYLVVVQCTVTDRVLQKWDPVQFEGDIQICREHTKNDCNIKQYFFNLNEIEWHAGKFTYSILQ